MKYRVGNRGYIVLISVLIIGSVSLAGALSLLLGGINNLKASLVIRQSESAGQIADSCVEEALLKLRDNPSFTGNGSLGAGNSICTYNVVNTGGDQRKLDIQGEQTDAVKKLEVYATINSSSISVTSYQEVP